MTTIHRGLSGDATTPTLTPFPDTSECLGTLVSLPAYSRAVRMSSVIVSGGRVAAVFGGPLDTAPVEGHPDRCTEGCAEDCDRHPLDGKIRDTATLVYDACWGDVILVVTEPDETTTELEIRVGVVARGGDSICLAHHGYSWDADIRWDHDQPETIVTSASLTEILDADGILRELMGDHPAHPRTA